MAGGDDVAKDHQGEGRPTDIPQSRDTRYRKRWKPRCSELCCKIVLPECYLSVSIEIIGVCVREFPMVVPSPRPESMELTGLRDCSAGA